MLNAGDLVSGRYKVVSLCNDKGGMGELWFVIDITSNNQEYMVLKYCKETEQEYINRFKREVRLLNEYNGNSKVVQLINFDLSNIPPYFIMKYYKSGDLLNIKDSIKYDAELQEKIFIDMIDCISVLHSRNQYHRDIKPQNFLLDDNGHVLVSDFGLSMEVNSATGFTKSSVYWGTHGYLPPEYLHDKGFKYADAAGDIFMLGKSFYVLLSHRDPLYIINNEIHPAIYHVIERACAINKSLRIQNIDELKSSVVTAYDIILNRNNSFSNEEKVFSEINNILESGSPYDTKKIIDFISKIPLMNNERKIEVCSEINLNIFDVIIMQPVVSQLFNFLDAYQNMVESHQYSFSYAEVIASNMKKIFNSYDVIDVLKAKALEMAIDAADSMNRYAAMSSCMDMITNVRDDNLASEVVNVIIRNKDTFITQIEPKDCKSDKIKNVMSAIKVGN